MLTAEQRGDLDVVMRRRRSAALPSLLAAFFSAGDERRVEIRSKLARNDDFVTRWTTAYEIQGLAGMVSLHPGRYGAFDASYRISADYDYLYA